jgi:hypothetical protein
MAQRQSSPIARDMLLSSTETLSAAGARPMVPQRKYNSNKDAHVQNNRHSRTRKVLVRRRKKKDLSLPRMFCAWLVEHQIGMSILPPPKLNIACV